MASLVYIDESTERTIFALEGSRLVIGRDPNSDVRIDEDAISAEHASINYENSQYVIRDHSLNGCFVNGEKVNARILRNNDILRFGRHLFLVNLSDDPVPIVMPLPQQASMVTARNSVVGRRMSPRPIAVPRGATRPLPAFMPYQYQIPLYGEKEKVNNREIMLFICLGILTILVCYFGYQSLTHQEKPETVKKEAAAAPAEASTESN
jgi:pSer/pThr/pTyr-binding forkhead associated (FHA) protein